MSGRKGRSPAFPVLSWERGGDITDSGWFLSGSHWILIPFYQG